MLPYHYQAGNIGKGGLHHRDLRGLPTHNCKGCG